MEEVFEVEKILGKKICDGEVGSCREFMTRIFLHNPNFDQFQVVYFPKWVGFSKRHNSWEPLANLDCHEMIEAYERSRAEQIVGISKRSGEIVYIIKVISRGIHIFYHDLMVMEFKANTI